MAKVIIVGEDDDSQGKGGGTKTCQCKAKQGNLTCQCSKSQWFAPGKVPKKFICPDCSANKHNFYGLS